MPSLYSKPHLAIEGTLLSFIRRPIHEHRDEHSCTSLYEQLVPLLDLAVHDDLIDMKFSRSYCIQHRPGATGCRTYITSSELPLAIRGDFENWAYLIGEESMSHWV